MCPLHLADHAVTHPHRDLGRGHVVRHDIKVRVERGHLEYFGHRQAHLVGQRRQVPVVEAAVPVLDQVQELNQQVPLPRLIR